MSPEYTSVFLRYIPIAQSVEQATDNRQIEVQVLLGIPENTLWSSLPGEGTRLLTENETGSSPVTTAKSNRVRAGVGLGLGSLDR